VTSYVLLKREYDVSIRSWFGFGRSKSQARKRSLLRSQRFDRRHTRRQRDAAADIAAVLQDAKYFDKNGPGNQEPY